MGKSLSVVIAVLILPVLGAEPYAPPDLPVPDEYVEDNARVVSAEHAHALNGILQELEQKTGVQYIILTIDATGGLPIEQFSIELLDKWKLGQKGKDNGLLFTVALQDRAYRFEVGYGLEGIIPDQFAGRVGREILEPYLKKGQYSQGIYEANLPVIRRIADGYQVKLTGMPTLSRPLANFGSWRGGTGGTCCGCPCCGFLLILVLILVLFRGFRRGRLWPWLLLPFLFRGFGGRGGHGRSGPFGGGPFGGRGGGFGGGFGRFGGGGGGRFGGGGAGGRW